MCGPCICVCLHVSPKCQIFRLNRPPLRNYLVLLCLSTEKSNYQLSGCVPRWPICLPVGNYWFSQCFSLLKPALLLLIRLLQSITIHKLCHSFPKLAVIPAAFSACLQRRKPQLNHTDRTNSISISVHVNSPKNVITYFIVCFFQINMYFQCTQTVKLCLRHKS